MGNFCMRCGRKIDPTDFYCMYCGTATGVTDADVAALGAPLSVAGVSDESDSTIAVDAPSAVGVPVSPGGDVAVDPLVNSSTAADAVSAMTVDTPDDAVSTRVVDPPANVPIPAEPQPFTFADAQEAGKEQDAEDAIATMFAPAASCEAASVPDFVSDVAQTTESAFDSGFDQAFADDHTPVSEPASRFDPEPALVPESEPALEPEFEPASAVALEPVLASEPAFDPEPAPAFGSALEPEFGPALTPAPEPSLDYDPASAPAFAPVSAPSPEPAPAPAPMPVPAPASAPMPTPAPSFANSSATIIELPTDAQGYAPASAGRPVLVRKSDGARFDVVAPCVIGRADNCEVRIDDYQGISRMHAKIYTDASGNYLVEDLFSTNNTYVGNERVTNGSPCRLDPGATLKLGSQEFEFVIE
ncbi:MAG: FHA domain-containing protein [Eggerthellaceae bacterium]|nr:FHA domain-containing protein [Eggerthellaceae bacterium]